MQADQELVANGRRLMYWVRVSPLSPYFLSAVVSLHSRADAQWGQRWGKCDRELV